MRARHPEAFERFIKAQTQMLATNNVIVLNQIGSAAMHYLSNHILTIPGVLSLVPSTSVNDDVKYKILIHHKNYHQVRDYLEERIPKWFDEHIEPDAKALEHCYPSTPEVAPIKSVGGSQADHTNMSISMNTAMSISSNISHDSPPTFIYQKDQFSSSTDASTLGCSHTILSIHRSSWADRLRSSSTNSSYELKSSKDSEN